MLCNVVFTTYRLFYFRGAGRIMRIPMKRGLPLGIRLHSIVGGGPCLLTLLKRLLFNFVRCKHGTSVLCCFACMRNSTALFSCCSVTVVIPDVVNTTYFPLMFEGANGGNFATTVFTFLANVAVVNLCFFDPGNDTVVFCLFSTLS